MKPILLSLLLLLPALPTLGQPADEPNDPSLPGQADDLQSDFDPPPPTPPGERRRDEGQPGRPHHPGFRGRWAPRRHQRELSDRQKDELVAFIRENLPDQYERLDALRERNPQRYQRMLQFLYPRMEHLQRMPEADREMMLSQVRLRAKIQRALREYRQADESEKPALREKIRALVAERFEMSQDMHRRRLEQMRNKLAELEQQLEQRLARREAIIDRMTEKVINGEFHTPPGRMGRPARTRDDDSPPQPLHTRPPDPNPSENKDHSQ